MTAERGGRNDPTLHARLQAATRAAHRRLDDALAGFDLTDRTSYDAFLRIHRAAMAVLVTQSGAEDRDDFDALLACLDTDLSLSPSATRVQSTPRAAGNGYRERGVAYVVRGSRLGAAFLKKQVPSSFPAAYLNHETTLSWPAFLHRLGATAPSDAQAGEEIIAAAQETFQVFISAAGLPRATADE
jgi:heme oxygenase (biliverdin-IX-beta and delta-forming)